MVTTANPYRTRAIAMFGLCALSCLLFILSVPLWYGLTEPMYMALLGVAVMLLAIPLHLMASSNRLFGGAWRKVFYWPAMMVNLAGTSLCEAAYYTHLGIRPDPSVLLAGAAVPMLLCILFAAIMAFLPDRYNLLTLIYGTLTFALMIDAIVFWVKTDSDVFFKLLGVFLVDIALLYACGDEEKTWLRFLSFASFGLLIVVAAVVLLILMCTAGDCDCGDCCDGCDCGIEGKPKARKVGKGK